ncbi:hypothetical protein ACFX1T_002491 [Malus domestica]
MKLTYYLGQFHHPLIGSSSSLQFNASVGRWKNVHGMKKTIELEMSVQSEMQSLEELGFSHESAENPSIPVSPKPGKTLPLYQFCHR